MDKWTPATVGSGFEFTPILKPLEPFRDRAERRQRSRPPAADTTAVHSLSPTTWLSGVRPKATQGVDAFAGSHRGSDRGAGHRPGHAAAVDGARHRGSLRPHRIVRPRLRLHLHEHAVVADAETPLPMEINPRKVFERMFGQGGSAAERLARIQEDRSILDAITQRGRRACSCSSGRPIARR